jgi:hypothetical protein
MVDRPKAIPQLNARSRSRVAQPILNGGAVKPLTLTSTKTPV